MKKGYKSCKNRNCVDWIGAFNYGCVAWGKDAQANCDGFMPERCKHMVVNYGKHSITGESISTHVDCGKTGDRCSCCKEQGATREIE